MKGLQIGRIVHFVLRNGEHRAAMIVKIVNLELGIVNLTVFTDWGNDGTIYDTRGMVHEQSVPFGDQPLTQVARTWHWPEKV